jgi:GntR family transcriptional repressor for pyruvate dehydrogenase complex
MARDARAHAEHPVFEQVQREPRLSDKVADAILKTIVNHGLRPGEKLPSERELGEQFGVSRTVVREAVRALTAKGVIEVRSGSGLRVAQVSPSAVSDAMSLLIRGSTALGYDAVHEVRQLIEIEIAGLAAERATDEDVELLREVCESMAEVLDDIPAAARADVEFHRTIAKITHNQLFLVVLDSVGDVMLEIRRRTLSVGNRPTRGLRYHRRIYERIAARDSGGAREAMRAHLEESYQAWKKLAREHPDETTIVLDV